MAVPFSASLSPNPWHALASLRQTVRMLIPEPVRSVVFDLDRTLLDHDRAVQGAARDWFVTMGVALTDIPAMTMLWMQAGMRQAQRFRCGELSYHEHRRQRVREIMLALGWAYSPAHADALFMAYLGGYAQHWIAYEDAAPVLRSIRESGRSVIVLTNGEEGQQRAKLRSIGLLELCDQVFASSRLPAAKPDRRAFQTVAQLQRRRPGECLMVGDDYDIDVRGALRAGWQAVHVDRSPPESRQDASGGPGDLRAVSSPERQQPGGIRGWLRRAIGADADSSPSAQKPEDIRTIHALSELTA